MRAFRALPVDSAVTQLVLLGALGWAAPVGGAAVAISFGCALVGLALLSRGLAGQGRRGLGPADHVTVTRATLACAVAALTAQSLLGHAHLLGQGPPLRHGHPTMLVAVAGLALVLDAVDGWVARHSRTETPLGARMDMEVDAFLILVLSVAASVVVGWWVLAIGAFRYGFLTATWVAPWLGGAVPPRWSRKAVAALQGVVLTVVTAQVLPRGACVAALAVALALLAWSFGTQVAELWPSRQRRVGPSGLLGDARAATPAPAVGHEAANQPARALE